MNSRASPVSVAHVKALRGFNRFYTQRIGVLAPDLGSELSLTEVRVLYELAHRKQPTAGEIGRDLLLDAGYLSRILRRFEARGWLARTASRTDARQSLLELTAAGHKVFAPLQQRSRDEAAALLEPLAPQDRHRAIDAMATLHQLLQGGAAASPSVVLREPVPGDMGWVVMQHGAVYAREYGFNWEFEGLVAGITAGFISNFKPGRDKGWIAEVDGERAGSAFVVQKTGTVAQLRLLVLVPEARGLGLGRSLVDECIGFARSAGYRKLVLWTNGHLVAARGIYKSLGFRLTQKEPFHGYGKKDLVGETWELKL